MNRSLVWRVIIQLCRFGLAAMFLFAVGAKLYMRGNPKESFFTNMPFLVGARWAMPVAFAIIAAELLAVLLLVIPRTARAGGVWAATLLLGFAVYALYYRFGLGNVEGLECGCFGNVIGSQLGLTTAFRNLGLLIPAMIVLFGYRRRQRVALGVSC
jgi:hypothetical protein